MRGTKPLPDAVKSFEGVLLLALCWIGIGWLLVHHTLIPLWAITGTGLQQSS